MGSDPRHNELRQASEAFNGEAPMQIAHLIGEVSEAVSRNPPAMLAGVALSLASKAVVLHQMAVNKPDELRAKLDDDPRYRHEFEAAITIIRMSLPLLEEAEVLTRKQVRQ